MGINYFSAASAFTEQEQIGLGQAWGHCTVVPL